MAGVWFLERFVLQVCIGIVLFAFRQRGVF